MSLVQTYHSENEQVGSEHLDLNPSHILWCHSNAAAVTQFRDRGSPQDPAHKVESFQGNWRLG